MSSGYADVLVQSVLCQRPNRGAVGKKRGLRVAGQRQLVGWPLETQAAQIRSQRGVDLTKSPAGNRKRIGQILSHSRLLGALAGKEQNNVHGARSE